MANPVGTPWAPDEDAVLARLYLYGWRRGEMYVNRRQDPQPVGAHTREHGPYPSRYEPCSRFQ